MLGQLQKLTDGIIIFSVLISDFEKLDFKNDALAGVRANYFNSKKALQQDKTEIEIDNQLYNLSYLMKSDGFMSWKVTRNNLPFQSVKRATGGIYCVMLYGDNGIIYKRQYFDGAHNWIRTEYFSRTIENKLACRVYPDKVCRITVLRIERITDNGIKTVKTLFPSVNKSEKKCSALIYSNIGMLWYDEKFTPDDLPVIKEESASGGFVFNTTCFKQSYKPANTIDMLSAGYLETENIENISDENIEKDELREYSAYDKIERILTEAHKTNKDLFGEIIRQTEEAHDTLNPENADDIIQNEQAQDSLYSESGGNDLKSESLKDTKEAINTNITVAANDEDNCSEDISFDIGSDTPCDAVIITKNGRYTYYGELDKNNCRTGRGRTDTPNGLTSYDGEYLDDMRNGFGVCYYKSGNINYVGNWKNNIRHGGGVGYRLSDGTMHAGKWNENTPDGYGARFDGNGEFLDVSMYENGVRNGKSVSFNEDGQIVISVYENGEKRLEKILDVEE